MHSTIGHKFAHLFVIALILAAPSLRAQHPAAAKPATATPKAEESELSHEIRHQLFVLPYYSVFDYISFSLDGGSVTLTGLVLPPALRANAEPAVKSLEGVSSVRNLI